MSKQFDIL